MIIDDLFRLFILIRKKILKISVILNILQIINRKRKVFV